MKLFIIYVHLIIICLFNCSLTLKNSNYKIQIIDITTKGQFFDLERKAVLENGNIKRIVFGGDDRLYITTQIMFHTKDIYDHEGKVIDNEIVKRDTTYMVYAVHKGGRFGLQYTYENFNTEKGIIVNVDSLWKNFGYDDVSLASLSLDLGIPDKVVSEKNIMLEKYAIKKITPADPDSIYRYYDKDLRDIDFSFSKKLDEKNKSKLYKTLIIFNSVPKGVALPDTEIPRRVLEHSMIKVAIKDTQIFGEIFEKFKKDREKIDLK